MNNHANISPSQPAHVEEEILRLGNAFFPVRALPDYCCKGKIVLPHWHSFLEILFIKTGIMDLNVNGRSYMLHSGDIMLINQYDVHGISDNPCTFEFLQVEAGFLTTFGIQLSACFPQSGEFCHLLANSQEASLLYPLLVRICSHAGQSDTSVRLMQLSDLLALFSYISVYTDCCSQKHHIRTVSAPSNLKTLDQAMHYIADNYTNAITLADVANYLGLTRNYFCRFFKQKTGKTFLGYLSMYRCLKAEDLLRDTDDSIASIALQVGFSSVSYFNKIYKRIRGSTPFEFRKTLA